MLLRSMPYSVLLELQVRSFQLGIPSLIVCYTAAESGPQGIRVNAVCPSWTETSMMETPFNKAPAFREHINKLVPLGRMAKPEEVAGVVTFLCSPHASYVHGTTMLVDGGLTQTVYPKA